MDSKRDKSSILLKRPHLMAAASGAARKKHPVKAVLAGLCFSCIELFR